jgi:hypothetical protein
MKAEKEITRRHPLAIAWDEWLASKEGQQCAEGRPTGEYLENRLHRAFEAGTQAGIDMVEKQNG